MKNHSHKIFHISNDYPYTNVYPEILKGLHESGCDRQLMYVPVQKMVEVLDPPFYSKNWDVVVSKDYGFFGRFLMKKRFSASSENAIRRHGVENFDIIHAHYLLTGGGVARLIKKETGVPYVCTVRGTDINYYLKVPYLRRLAAQILMDADKVTFLSPSQRATTISMLGELGRTESFLEKCSVVPNGISEEWINNLGSPRFMAKLQPIRLLYVGELTKNKNWKSVVACHRLLARSGVQSTLTIVGDGKDRAEVVAEAKMDKHINYVGFVSDRNILIQLYRQSDIFIMPSFSETFGLSYLEAMSQGLPVIYSHNQGIDGFFKNNMIGCSVDPRSVENIVESIMWIWNHLDEMSKNCLNEIPAFTWSNVVKSYLKVYNECLDGLTG